MADLTLTPGFVCPSLTITLTHGTLLVCQYKTYRFAELHVGEKSNLGFGGIQRLREETIHPQEYRVQSRVFNKLFTDLKREAKDEIKSKNLMTNPRAHTSHSYQTKKVIPPSSIKSVS